MTTEALDTTGTRALDARRARRLAGWLAILGTALSVIVNVLHPHQDVSTDHFLQEISDSGWRWVPLHFGIILAVLFDTLAMRGIGAALRGIARPDILRYANTVAVISGAVMICLMGIDGFAAKYVADAYTAAGPGIGNPYFPVGDAILAVLLGWLGIWYFLYLGVATFLYGLALLQGPIVAQRLGRLGLLAGAGSMIDGALIYLTGASFLVTTLLFLIFSFLGFAWLALCGVWLLKTPPPAEAGLTRMD